MPPGSTVTAWAPGNQPGGTGASASADDTNAVSATRIAIPNASEESPHTGNVALPGQETLYAAVSLSLSTLTFQMYPDVDPAEGVARAAEYPKYSSPAPNDGVRLG